MIQLILFITFIVSTGFVIFSLYRKIPVLLKLPQNGHHGIKKNKVIANIENRVKSHYFHFFEKQMLLHTFLSKFRILILKTERFIGDHLHGIRKKAQELDKKAKDKK